MVARHVRSIQRFTGMVFERVGLGSRGVNLDQGHENPRGRDPRDAPSNLAVRVVLIQLRCLVVVDETKEQRKSVHDEEDKLRGNG